MTVKCKARCKGHVLLHAYLSSPDAPTKSQFAAQAGLTLMELSHLIHERRRAGLRQAIAIYRATDGVIDPSAWLEAAD
jgi:hypothetical protein